MAADLASALASLMQVPGMQELLNSSITQQRELAPVRTAVNQQALNTMPSSAFGAGRPNVSAIAPANFSTPAPPQGSDLLSNLLKIGGGGAAGAALMKALGGGNGASGNLGPLGQALRKLFGGGNFGHDLGAVGDPSSGPAGNWLPSYDPFAANPNTGMPNDPMGPAVDPSGGSGIGPGMSSFYSGGGSAPTGGGTDDGGWSDY